MQHCVRALTLFGAFRYCFIAIISSNYLNFGEECCHYPHFTNEKLRFREAKELAQGHTGTEVEPGLAQVWQPQVYMAQKLCLDHSALLLRACATAASSSSLHSLHSSCLQGTCLHRIRILRAEDTKVFLSRALIKQGT